MSVDNDNDNDNVLLLGCLYLVTLVFVYVGLTSWYTVIFRVSLWAVTLSLELCVSASPGRGWLEASTETTRDLLMHTLNRTLVSEIKQTAVICSMTLVF